MHFQQTTHPVIVLGGDLGSAANSFRLPLHQSISGMNPSCSQCACSKQVDGAFLGGMLGMRFCSSYLNRDDLEEKGGTLHCAFARGVGMRLNK